MNRASAKTWLGRATAATSEPALVDADLEALLEFVGPGATVFDTRMLDRAAAEGWSWKVNSASENYGRESDIYEHCKEREQFYKTRSASGGSVVKAADTDSVTELL